MIASLRERRSMLNGLLKTGPLAEMARPLSWMMVPLFSGDAIYGTIVCCSNARHYDAGDLELLEEIGRRASLALEHAESFARERRLIQTLQKATLPTQLARVEGAALSAIYRPAASEVQVGGDWYDAYDLDEDRVLLTVGDVTGHGLEASIVMGSCAMQSTSSRSTSAIPCAILDAAERILLRRYPASVATAFVAILDLRAARSAMPMPGIPIRCFAAGTARSKSWKPTACRSGCASVGGPVTPVSRRLDDAALLGILHRRPHRATRDTLPAKSACTKPSAPRPFSTSENPANSSKSTACAVSRPMTSRSLWSTSLCSALEVRIARLEAAKIARREFAAALDAAGMPERSVKTIL